VFEWGAGSSTVWLNERDLTVTSIESKREWAQKVLERCPNADVRFIPWGTTTGGKGSWDDYVGAIDRFEDECLDIVIVDGMCRERCAARAAPKVKPGGMIIVDDTDRFYLSLPKQFPGWRRDRVAGFKRSAKPLTETSFFYKPSAT
jgi:hypothetical protein